jgi:hypothetical protein
MSTSGRLIVRLWVSVTNFHIHVKQQQKYSHAKFINLYVFIQKLGERNIVK